MASPITQMLRGEIPCHKIDENALCFAFLEPRPLARGHLVCASKLEIDSIFDLDDETFSDLALFAKKNASRLLRIVPCVKIAVIAYGLKVRHAHLHLIPVDGTTGEIDLTRDRVEAPEKDLISLADSLRGAL